MRRFICSDGTLIRAFDLEDARNGLPLLAYLLWLVLAGDDGGFVLSAAANDMAGPLKSAAVIGGPVAETELVAVVSAAG